MLGLEGGEGRLGVGLGGREGEGKGGRRGGGGEGRGKGKNGLCAWPPQSEGLHVVVATRQ